MSLPPPLPQAPKSPSPVHLAVPALSLLLFLVSLFLPAIRLDNGEVWSGGAVLLMGWMGVFLGEFGWVANLFYLVALGLGCFRRTLVAAVSVAVLAVLLGLAGQKLVGRTIPLDEANVRKAVVTRIGPAYPVWLTALAVPVLGLFFRLRAGSRSAAN